MEKSEETPSEREKKIDELVKKVAESTGGSLTKFPSRRASERSLVLSDTTDKRGHLTTSISIDDSGAFYFRGYDTGPIVSTFFGCDYYEWVYTVPAERVPNLVAALEGNTSEDILELVKRKWDEGIKVKDLLKSDAIKADFHNWHGFN
jgi:hypothetical protein